MKDLAVSANMGPLGTLGGKKALKEQGPYWGQYKDKFEKPHVGHRAFGNLLGALAQKPPEKGA